MMVPTLLANTIDRIFEPAVRVSAMVAAMLISNSWLKAGGIIPLERKLFQWSGCKRRAGISARSVRGLARTIGPMISFDAEMPKKAAPQARIPDADPRPAAAAWLENIVGFDKGA